MALDASERHSDGRVDCTSFGARVQLEERSEPPTNDFGDLVCCAPYYNPTTNKVEWVERETFGRPTFHRCSVEKWQELANEQRA